MISTIKPRDIVRTPSGRTAKVIEILPRGFRLLEYLDDHEGVELHESLLFVVQSAIVVGFAGAIRA